MRNDIWENRLRLGIFLVRMNVEIANSLWINAVPIAFTVNMPTWKLMLKIRGEAVGH